MVAPAGGDGDRDGLGLGVGVVGWVAGGEEDSVDLWGCVFNRWNSVFSCGLSIFSNSWNASYSLMLISDVSLKFILWNCSTDNINSIL